MTAFDPDPADPDPANPDPANPDPANPDPANPDPGGLTVRIEDREVLIAMTGGGHWTIPIGPVGLTERELHDDPPRPADLTNVLGFVHDYFDDVIVEAPSVLATPSVHVTGHHAVSLAQVELGRTTIPADYRLARADADEVFRTLVAEPTAERLHNPGLDDAHVTTIIATSCVVLAIMRRLDLGEIQIRSGDQ